MKRFHAIFTLPTSNSRDADARAAILPKSTQPGAATMSEFCACKKGFQTASGIFAQAILAQSVIVTAIVLVGAVVI